MRSRAVLVLAAVLTLAGCDGEGVSIEIRRGSTSAERVELYIMDGVCTTDPNGEFPCTQLKTPSSTTYLEGHVYTRDDARTLGAPMEDGVAYFNIRSNGDDTRIPLLVAVGFDGNDTRVGAVMIDREFFTTDKVRRIATLETIVEDHVTGRPASDGLRVETWYADPNGCVALEKTTEGDSERTFIVPAADPDCDGWAEPEECDAMWPDRNADDNRGQRFTCLDEESASGSSKMCLLGASPCIDGEGEPECRAVDGENGTTWCVPSALCEPLCEGSSSPQCLYTALKHPTEPPDKHPTYVHCKVPVFTTPSGHYQVCRASIATTLLPPWPVPTTTTCSNLWIGRVTATEIGSFTMMRTSTTPEVHSIRTDLAQPCVPSLQFSGDFPSTTVLHDAWPENVLRLDMTNGRSLVIPLVVELDLNGEDSCSNAEVFCTVRGVDPAISEIDESLAACARS